MTHLPGIPSNGMPHSLCGKSKITFVPTEWIASEWQQATGQISCAKCRAFLAEFNQKGGENQMEEMKATIRRWHWGLELGGVYTVSKVYPNDRGIPGTCVLLAAGGYVESPTPMREDSIGRSFKVIAAGSPTGVDGGTATIVEVVKDSAGNWVEKVRPGIGAEVPKPVTDYKRVIKHFNASAYQDPSIVGNNKYPTWRGSANAVGDVFLVVPGGGSDKVHIQVVENSGHKMTNYIESPYANSADAIGKAFKVIAGDGINWTIEEVPVDQVGRAASAGAAVAPYPPSVTSKIDNIATSCIKSEPSTIVKEQNIMVFQGIVVREKTVQAGEGVTTGVKNSEVIYVTDKPVVAADTGAAKAIILARAIVAVKDLDVEDTTKPVTVQALQYSSI